LTTAQTVRYPDNCREGEAQPTQERQMTTTTATASDIKPGDRVYETVGARNYSIFEVESVQMSVTRSGCIVWTFDGYNMVNAGICGPSQFSLLEGDTVQVIA
jgi:hypothetical protein